MIIYDLTCSCGYQFEGWFQDRADYDQQSSNCLLQCPVCQGSDIHKILSPVASVTSHTGIASKLASDDCAISDKPLTEKEIKEFIGAISKYVKDTYQDVGSKLAETALKMHYGVEEEKKIRGVATAKEEQMLAEEGIHLVKIPLPLDETEEN